MLSRKKVNVGLFIFRTPTTLDNKGKTDTKNEH